ncbi:hypothetical protein BJV74DRAFT_859541, partial [Russula compacta]
MRPSTRTAAPPTFSPPPPAPSPASISGSSSISTASAPQRRAGRRRPQRVRRTPCEFCAKTFARIQDAQRHMATSCSANPDKMGVECPECHSVLSRLDAAQRHWRGHENPTCETPAWAQRYCCCVEPTLALFSSCFLYVDPFAYYFSLHCASFFLCTSTYCEPLAVIVQ